MVTGEGGIHRNWMSTAIISISVTTVQTVFQTGVWFCYKCSRLVSDSAVSAPDRCLVLLSVFQRDRCLVLEQTRLEIAFRFHFLHFLLQEYQRGWGWGVVGSLRFDVQEWGGLAQFGQTEKGGRGGVQKLDIFLGCHKCMNPMEKHPDRC